MSNPLSNLNTGIQSQMQKIINQMTRESAGSPVSASAPKETYSTTGIGGTNAIPGLSADYFRNLFGNQGGSSSASGNQSSSASAGTTPVYSYPTYEQYYQGAGYQAAQEAQQQALQEAINQILSSVQIQKQTVAQEAGEAARQAYISYMQSKTALPQALASKGYHGGLADSYLVGLETNFQNNQNQIALNKGNTLSQLEQAAISAQSQASREGAEKLADIALAAANSWNSYISQINNLANTNYWKQLEADNTAQNTAANQRAGSMTPFQWVKEMIGSGMLPDNNILQLPGLSAAERKRLEEMMR